MDESFLYTLNGWDENAKSLLLPKYLTNRAKHFYLGLSKETKKSATLTLEALRANFDSSAARHQARNLAAERVQKANESVSDYFAALGALCRRAYAHLGKKQERERFKEAFMTGLTPQLKKIFWDLDPNTLEEALLLAEKREAYIKQKRKTGLSVNMVDIGNSGC